jgi:hypothetical protein
MTWPWLLLFAIWLFGFSSAMLGLRRAPRVLARWAERNGLVILERRQPCFGGWYGPFMGASNLQVLYRVLCVDEKGTQRRALVLCGSRVRGCWGDRVEVHWEPVEAPRERTRRLASEAETRFRLESGWRMGLRYLLVGAGLGVSVMLVLLFFVSPMHPVLPEPVVLLLAISLFFGAGAGVFCGFAGGWILAWLRRIAVKKPMMDEL